MERHSAGPVEKTTRQMNSGYVVMSVRSGFMESVLRSHQLGQSTLSSTSAHLAATRELAHDISRPRGGPLTVTLG